MKTEAIPGGPKEMIAREEGKGFREEWRKLWGVLSFILQKGVREQGTDRYRKHFFTIPHVAIVVYHHLNCSQSLTESLEGSLAHPSLPKDVGLPKGVSLSQMSRSNAERSPWVLLEPIAFVLNKLRAAHRSSLPDFPKGLHAIDASFLKLFAKLCPWAKDLSGHQPGVKLQVVMDVTRHLPERIVLSMKPGSDRQSLPELLGELTGWKGQTLLFDLGYYSHRWFGELMLAGVKFITRLHPQAMVDEMKPLELGEDDRRYGVVKSALVFLGSYPTRLKEEVRLVQVRVEGEVWSYLTNRYDLSAWEVADIYRYRWDIELFFRWLKRVVHIGHPLGHSPLAFIWTVLSAILAYLLIRWVQVLTGGRRMATARRLLRNSWSNDSSHPHSHALPVPT